MKKCFYIFQLTFVGLVLLLLSACTATHYSANRYKKNHRATERWVHRLYKKFVKKNYRLISENPKVEAYER